MIRERSEKGRFMGDLGIKAVSELLCAVLGILVFSILARTLSKPNYAFINQGVAMNALLSPILLVKMNAAFSRFLPSEENRTVIKSRFFSCLLACLPLCLGLWLVAQAFSGFFSKLLFGSTEYADFISLMALYNILFALSTLAQDFNRGIRQIGRSSLLLVVKGVLLCLAFSAAFSMTPQLSLKSVLILYCLADGVAFLLGLWGIVYDFKDVALLIAFRPLREYYVYALPLMPGVILSWANGSVDKLLLNHLMGMETAAVYGFYFSLVGRAFFLSTVLSYIIFPYVSKFWNEGDQTTAIRYLHKAARIGIFFAFPLIAGISVVLPTVVALLSGGAYPVHLALTFLLCASAALQMLQGVYSYLMDLSHKTLWYSVIFLCTSVVNIACNLLLIPFAGIYGSAVAKVVADLLGLMLTLRIASTSARIRVALPGKYMLRVLCLSTCMYVAVRFCYRNTGLVSFAFSVLVGVGVYFGLSLLWVRLRRQELL